MNQVARHDDSIAVDYFNGTSSKRHTARIRVTAQTLLIEGEGISREVPMSQIRWPERTRHGVRIAYLGEHGSVQCADSLAWDPWAQANGLQESLVVKAQQSWSWVLASIAALVSVVTVSYVWVLPAAAQAALQITPAAVDAAVGEAALMGLERSGSMQPSHLSKSEQQTVDLGLKHEFSPLNDRLPEFRIVFRKSVIGANAFALPGGTIVITDRMVELCKGDTKFLSAVLAHELGHLHHRHGMLILAKASAMGLAASAIWGDFSGTLASVPVLLGAAGYSRDAEREADAFAVLVLGKLNRSPAEMVHVLDVLAKDHQHIAGSEASENAPDLLSIAFASHPLDNDRKAYFSEQIALPR